MLDRRRFLGCGLAAVATGLLPGVPQRLLARAPRRAGAPFDPSDPVALIDTRVSALVDDFSFGAFSGDWPDLPGGHHPPMTPLKDVPEPNEFTDLVVVGGGLSGLACAYLLREMRPIVLEHQNRFGGASQGEQWNDTMYTLGGAYFITPDKNSFLESFYRELGLDKVVRVDGGANPAELHGEFLDDFYTSAAIPKEDRPAFEAYRQAVLYFTKQYPDIPLPEGEDNQWILDLDRVTLKDDVEKRIGGPAPALLAAAVQSYCYSSFGVGWEEISAASGWNFIAAEEFGRWVLPGGNAYMVRELWRRLSELRTRGSAPLLRAGRTVWDVRLVKNGVQVTYAEPDGTFRAILAQRVVMACPKYVVKHILHGMAQLDPAKQEAIDLLEYRPYVVANVLVNQKLARDFYDLFLLGDGVYPVDSAGAEAFSRPTDVVTGHFARPGPGGRSVLTLYWPLPWATARFTLVPPAMPLQSYAQRLRPHLDNILALLEVPRKAVEQVRFTRWGHALPVASPNLIADGHCDALRRPIEDRIYFVEQDNWALPAVETCLLEAQAFALELSGALRR